MIVSPLLPFVQETHYTSLPSYFQAEEIDLFQKMCIRDRRETLEGFKDSRRHALDVGDALDGAGTVAEDGEEELAAFARVVEPAFQGDGLAFVLAECGDGRDWRGDRSVFWGGGYGFFGHGLLALWAAQGPGSFCEPGGRTL